MGFCQDLAERPQRHGGIDSMSSMPVDDSPGRALSRNRHYVISIVATHEPLHLPLLIKNVKIFFPEAETARSKLINLHHQ
eukprot:scaffold44344_cov35-Prasinocladus_malaysianus.AAC.2